MFENIEVLSKERHADLKMSPVTGFEFAREVPTAPLSIRETVQAARFYVVVFPKEGPAVPQALLSLRKGQNDYIAEDGRWRAPYIPAHIRQYPFILSKSATEETYAVCIDRDAPHFQAEDGDLLFSEDGEPTEALNRVQTILTRFQQEMVAGRQLLQDLLEQDLLMDRQFTIESNGSRTTVSGFRAVDFGKLSALDDARLAGWVRNGLMSVVLAHLQSLENVRSLNLSPALEPEDEDEDQDED